MKGQTYQIYKERIDKVLGYIDSHMDEPLLLDHIASLACFSPYHFHRIFRGMMGVTLADHIRKLRLKHAAEQLRITDIPITDISLNAGYDSLESFIRAFKSYYTIAPGHYRKLYTSARNSLEYASRPETTHDQYHASVTTGYNALESVRVESVPKMKVVCMRHIGAYNQVGEAFARLMAWMVPRKLINKQTIVLAIYHDNPDITAESELRSDAAMTLPKGYVCDGSIETMELGGGTFVVARHRGSYNTLGESWNQLMGIWTPEHDYMPRDELCFEIYRNNPEDVRQEDLITEIYEPVERVR